MTSAAVLSLATPSPPQGSEQGSGPDGEPRAAAPVTVAAARQAILSKFQAILSDMRPRPGGGLSSARFLPQFPLPVTLLSEALAYPSLVKDVQLGQAQQQQQQQQEQQQQQQQQQQHQHQPSAIPLPLAAGRRVDPTPVPAPATNQPRGSQQPARRTSRTRGGRNARLPRRTTPEGACRADLPAMGSAPVDSDGELQQRQRQQGQHRVSVVRPPTPMDVHTAPPDGQPLQPEVSPAAASQARQRPGAVLQMDAAGSGEETDDDTWAPSTKRTRRSTAAAVAHRQASAKASECDLPVQQQMLSRLDWGSAPLTLQT